MRADTAREAALGYHQFPMAETVEIPIIDMKASLTIYMTLFLPDDLA